MIATTTRTDSAYTYVQYHQTDVVKFNAKNIVLNSGGWLTATTKKRMNQTSEQHNLGYKVYAKSGKWFVDFKGGTIDFCDGLTLTR